jgi:hypothetical protein
MHIVSAPVRLTGPAANNNDEEAAMSESTRRLSRRHFLFTVGAGGAATAAAIVAKRAPTVPQITAGSAKRASRGYQASEHVRRYYRTTKV